MNKQADFNNDLAALHENVNASVGDVLEVLQRKRSDKQLQPSVTPARELIASTQTSDVPESAPSRPSAAKQPRRQRMALRSRLSSAIEREEPLENVTTRLRQKTNELLTETALRQRLKKVAPATRQDIIEAALEDWFSKHGYSRGCDEGSID